MTLVEPPLRLNIGSGGYNLPQTRGWQNIDARNDLDADEVCVVPPLPYVDASVEEIYAGHFLEHLPPWQARIFLGECLRVLVPGGRLGVVVPDTREIMRRYLAGGPDVVECPPGVFHAIADLDDICAMFLYSTIQPSSHFWSYDSTTLRKALELAGFRVTGEIDRHADPRIPVGAWYQVGWDAVKP